MQSGSSIWSLPQDLQSRRRNLYFLMMISSTVQISFRCLVSLTFRVPEHMGQTDVSLLFMKNIWFLIEKCFVVWYYYHDFMGTTLRTSILPERVRNEVLFHFTSIPVDGIILTGILTNYLRHSKRAKPAAHGQCHWAIRGHFGLAKTARL